MYFVFFAPKLYKYRHIDFIKTCKTLKAAKKFIKDDCAFMRRAYPGEPWPEKNYFIAKRMR